MGFSHIYSLDGLSNIFVFKGRVLEVAPSVGTVVRTSIPRKEPLIDHRNLVKRILLHGDNVNVFTLDSVLV